MSKKIKLITGSLLFLASLLFVSRPAESANFLKQAGNTIRRVMWGTNFRTVEDDILYRSCQLPPKQLKKFIERYDIKTIINLRTIKENEDDWNKEKEFAQQNNILFFSIEMDATIITPEEKLKQLSAIFLTAPTPILVHCKAGADRTGEACALYKLLMGSSKQDALEQLSIRYGHFSYFLPKKHELITSLDEIYPDFLKNMEKICPSDRFTIEELKDLDAAQFFAKLKNKSNC